ncbi:MAG TPA: hypothetical protein VGD09_05230 [Blastococcus sp.]
MLPLHPLTPLGGATAPEDRRGRIRALVLTSVSLLVLAAVAGPTAALVTLSLAAITLAAAALLGRRARRAAATITPAPAGIPMADPSTADAEAVTPDVLTERLRVLHDDHVEQVNMALAEGREDLAQELSDSYMDESLALITTGGRRSPDHFHIQ